MKPVEIVFKDFIIKLGLLPFILTISMVVLVIVITMIMAIKEIRRS